MEGAPTTRGRQPIIWPNFSKLHKIKKIGSKIRQCLDCKNIHGKGKIYKTATLCQKCFIKNLTVNIKNVSCKFYVKNTIRDVFKGKWSSAQIFQKQLIRALNSIQLCCLWNWEIGRSLWVTIDHEPFPFAKFSVTRCDVLGFERLKTVARHCCSDGVFSYNVY